MLRIRNPKKKALAVLGGMLLIALMLPFFAAFEAHVINVKAHIENALEVSPKHIDFGVVFPQERLARNFRVALSKSFMRTDQRRVKDVEYEIVQKRKPKSFESGLDVVFVFDVTGSMGGVINSVKAKAIEIMDTLAASTPDAKFAVTSHSDYPHWYDSYGYAADYGKLISGDYAYNLDSGLSADTGIIAGVINGLSLKNGWDLPQNYTRMMYESYADPGIGWRAGTEHVVILIGDDVPHDNDVNQGVPGKIGPWSTGGDPGRDETMTPGAGDDLDFQTELSNLVTNGIKLYALHSGGELDYWTHWTSITGGKAVNPSDHTDIVDAIKDLFLYPDLRPFLYKEKDPGEKDTDTEEVANLDKSIGDIVDNWRVELHVPCISSSKCQDHGTDKCVTFPCGGPRHATCQAIPESPPGSGEAGDYGADIWVEVRGLSYFSDSGPAP